MKSMLLEIIGDSIENRILDFLIEGKGNDYTKKDIAEGCTISRPTLYKIFPKLAKGRVVISTRTIGRIQLYTLNVGNPKIAALLKLEEFLLTESFAEVAQKKLATQA